MVLQPWSRAAPLPFFMLDFCFVVIIYSNYNQTFLLSRHLIHKHPMPKKSRIRKACKSKIAFLEEKNHFVKNVVVEHFVSMADEDM